MAENRDESEVIKLLLNFEKEASLIVDEAMVESEKRISNAKSTANSDFQRKYESIVQDMEADYNQKILEIENNHTKKLEEYKNSLETKNQNKQAFFTFVDSVFFNTEVKK